MKICRIQGIAFEINNWFLALLGVYFAAGVLGKGLIAFAVVFFHELAHVWAARKAGLRISGVELLPFGGVARVSSELILDPKKEIFVAAAGPLTNLFLAVLVLGLGQYGYWSEAFSPFFVQCNLMLFLFNLLPGLPLDGGRVFRARLARRMNLPEATLRMARWGQCWGALMTLLGAAGVALGFCGLDIVATGLFLFYAARRDGLEAPYLYANHLINKERDLQRAGILPGEVLVVHEDLPVWKVTRLFVPQKYHLVFLVDGQGRIVDTLEETRVVKTVIDEGPYVPVKLVKKGF
ncbi:M50 family metallopeptidase [Desulforudis sp. 1088]|uniref:M50 family metallopeptidase n=1 Tax=unclassified Candidatus Desulforudis TaxID=2635950 RepID=UPI00349286B1